MALGSNVNAAVLAGSNTPVSVQSAWTDVVSNCETAHNSGGVVLAPGALTSNTISPYYINGKGTTIQARMKYTVGATVTTPPTIQIFGFDINGLPERLLDSDGTHELQLAASAANDVQLGTAAYTEPAEVDGNGSIYIMVTVKVAADTSTGIPTIQVRVK